MGKTLRKKYTPEFKAQVAIGALKEQWVLAFTVSFLKDSSVAL